MSEWQDIETAPKDGTKILAYESWYGPRFGVIFWEDGFWRDYTDEYLSPSLPTHWMPLPEAPR